MRPYSFKNMHGGGQDVHNHLVVDDEDDDLGCPSSSDSDSTYNSSSDSMDDATSPPQPLPSLSSSCSPLYEMSALIAELPIKKGLSRHFQGKSQSFTSLTKVRCLEDLVKPGRTWRKKAVMKPCRSYGGGLDVSHRTIAKKSSKGLLPSCLSGAGRREERKPTCTGSLLLPISPPEPYCMLEIKQLGVF